MLPIILFVVAALEVKQGKPQTYGRHNSGFLVSAVRRFKASLITVLLSFCLK